MVILAVALGVIFTLTASINDSDFQAASGIYITISGTGNTEDVRDDTNTGTCRVSHTAVTAEATISGGKAGNKIVATAKCVPGSAVAIATSTIPATGASHDHNVATVAPSGGALYCDWTYTGGLPESSWSIVCSTG